MKTYPQRSSSGELHAFEIENILTSRRKVLRIVKSIPGVKVISSPMFLSWFRESTVCRFSVDGQEFSVEEPFGDNSRYLISAEPPGPCAQFGVVEKAFNEA